MRQRYAAKADKTTQQIVDELRALHYTVIHIGRPVDLLVTHGNWPRNTFRLLECKSPKGEKLLVKLRKDQQAQQDFCALHEIPYCTDGLTALTYLQGYSP
jgi:hypothetical protein